MNTTHDGNAARAIRSDVTCPSPFSKFDENTEQPQEKESDPLKLEEIQKLRARYLAELRKAEEEKDKIRKQLDEAREMRTATGLPECFVHDMNNILTAIMGYGYILKLKLKDESLGGFAENIFSLSDKAVRLIRDVPQNGK